MPLFVVVWPLVPFPLLFIFKIDKALLPTQETKNDSHVWLTHIVPGLWKTGTTLASHLCLSQFGSHCSSLCLSSSHLHPITFPPGLHTSLVTAVLSPVSIHVCLYRSITVYLNAGLSISWYLHSSEHVDVSPAAVKSSERLRAPETIFAFATSKFSEMWQNCVL